MLQMVTASVCVRFVNVFLLQLHLHFNVLQTDVIVIKGKPISTPKVIRTRKVEAIQIRVIAMVVPPSSFMMLSTVAIIISVICCE